MLMVSGVGFVEHHRVMNSRKIAVEYDHESRGLYTGISSNNYYIKMSEIPRFSEYLTPIQSLQLHALRLTGRDGLRLRHWQVYEEA